MLKTPIEICCEEIVRYLKDRNHPEAPQISTLSPDISLKRILQKSLKVGEATLISDEDDDEGALEDLERISGSSTFGVEADFSNLNENSKLKFSVSFCIRKKIKIDERHPELRYDSEFCQLNVEAVLEGTNWLLVKVQEIGENCQPTRSASRSLAVNADSVYRIGFGNKFALEKLLGSERMKPPSAGFNIFDEGWLSEALEVDTNALRLSFEDLSGKRQSTESLEPKPHVTFLLEFRILNKGGLHRIRFNIRHIGCLSDSNEMVIYVNYLSAADPASSHASVKHLFEVSGVLHWEGASRAWEKTDLGLRGIMPIGGLILENGDSEIIIQDWAIAKEEIGKISFSSKAIKESLSEAARQFGLDPMAAEILSNAITMALGEKIHALYAYQENATGEILKALFDRDYASKKVNAIVIQARTAGGKTYAFLLPILLYLINSKLRKSKKSVQFILMYPTVALANDQADEMLKLIYFINSQLADEERISIGMLNQYVESRYSQQQRESGGSGLRLSCPLCGDLLELVFEIKGAQGSSFRIERARCRNPGCEINKVPIANETLNSSLRLTREAIYSGRPELLITTPDFINARLTLQGEEDPMALSILGKPFSYCMGCGRVYRLGGRECKDGCGGKLVQANPGTPLKAVVIDEAHLFKGEFGAQVSHLILRMEKAIKEFHGSESYRPLHIISSATLNGAIDRASELVVCDRNRVLLVEPEPGQISGSEPLFRHHVFLMPKTYRPDALAERALEVPFGCACGGQREGSALGRSKTLVFVNSISQANDLVNHFRRMMGSRGVRVGGHTTDWHRERAKVEDEFLKGQIDILVATRGLEVGVDFDNVSVGVIFGAPYYLSDYVQRIGRIGRKNDSIILNILTPDKNINFFYFINWHLLSDPGFRESHMRHESGMINNCNFVSLEKCAKRVAFDWLSVKYPLKGQLGIDVLVNEIEHYFRDCIQPLKLGSKTDDLVKRLRDFVLRTNAWQLNDSDRIIRELKRNKMGYLSDLRSFDDQVEVRIGSTDTKSKNLGVMFRRSMEGMIFSFKGRYYTVATVEGKPAFYK